MSESGFALSGMIQDVYEDFFLRQLGAGEEMIAKARQERAAFNALPREERERITAEREAKILQDRADVRAAATPVALTLEGLVARMGWEPGYAEHLVQTYCTCDWGWESWDECQHWEDERRSRG